MPMGEGYPEKGSVTISKTSVTVSPEARKKALKKKLSHVFLEDTANGNDKE